MADNENMGLGFVPDIFAKIDEERRIQEQEWQIRYAERKRQKTEHRRAVENAAMKICAAVEKATESGADQIDPEELVKLAAALSHAGTAMQAMENYAEYMPYGGGFCAV
ncbi:MAG: hypothetical protein IKL84_00805 [Clostridia bacterium]|nr:hypothetical protein [Clostridia bacterium]